MSLEADDLARFPTLARLVLGLVAKKGKYEYCYLFSSSDSWSKSAKLDLKLLNHRQLAPNWKSMVTH